MSDKVKIALLSAATSILVAGISTGVVSATQEPAYPNQYIQERALILDTLKRQSRTLERIDERTRRLELHQARIEALLEKGGK